MADDRLLSWGWGATIGDADDAIVANGDVVACVLVQQIEQHPAASFCDQFGHHRIIRRFVVAYVACHDSIGYTRIGAAVERLDELGCGIHLFQAPS